MIPLTQTVGRGRGACCCPLGLNARGATGAGWLSILLPADTVHCRVCAPWEGVCAIVGPTLAGFSIPESTSPEMGKDGDVIQLLLSPLLLALGDSRSPLSPSNEAGQAGILPDSRQQCALLLFIRKGA